MSVVRPTAAGGRRRRSSPTAAWSVSSAPHARWRPSRRRRCWADAGMVLISPSNTSPALTSDLEGSPAEHYVEGYYRTAHNDLFQGKAVARFLRNERGLTRAAVIHTGDVYTWGLAEAFINAFEELGGTITGTRDVNREATDLVPALTALAWDEPEALFLPVSQTVGEAIVGQAPGVAGMEDVLLITGDGLIDDEFMALPETEGMFFSGPEIHFGDNRNESTGRSAPQVLAAYEDLLRFATRFGVLGSCLRCDDAAPRGDRGVLQHVPRLAGHRQGGRARVPRRRGRLRRAHRRDHLRRLRRLRRAARRGDRASRRHRRTRPAGPTPSTSTSPDLWTAPMVAAAAIIAVAYAR